MRSFFLGGPLVSQRFLFAALIFVVAVLPFQVFVHLFPLPNFGEYAVSALAVIMGFSLALVVAMRQGYLPLYSGFFVLLFLCAVLMALFGLGGDFSQGGILVLYWLILLMAAIFVSVAREALGGDFYSVLAASILVGGIIQAVGGLSFHYGLSGDWLSAWLGGAPTGRLIGFIGQSNMCSIYVFCAFLSGCYLFLVRRVSLFFLLFLSFLFGVVMAAAGSRAAFVYFCIALLALLWLWGAGKGSRRCLGVGLAMFFLLLAVPFYVVFDSWVQPILQAQGYLLRGSVVEFGRDYQALGFRPSEWLKAWLMLKESPWLGVGFGNYGVNSFWMGVDYSWAVTEEVFPAHSHNIFMQVAAEFGAFGLLALIAALAYFAFHLLSAKKTPEWWFLCAACGAFFVNSMLEYVLWYVNFAVLLVFFLVPFVGQAERFFLSRFLGVGGVFVALVGGGVIFWLSLSTYVVVTGLGMKKDASLLELRMAGADPIWGRYVRSLELARTPYLMLEGDVEYMDNVTREMMKWRPYSQVVVHRMHVLAVKKEYAELERLAIAVSRFYPSSAMEWRDFLLSLDGVKGTPAEGVLMKYMSESG